MTALLVDHPYIFLRNPTNNPTCQMIPTTNRNLWAEEPHHRPTQQELVSAARKNNYLPDPYIPLHQQTLLGVTPPTPEQKAEADWELPEESVHNRNDGYSTFYQEHQAAIRATTERNAATVRQLEQDQSDRFRQEFPEYVQPELIRSESYNRIKRIVG